MCGIHVVVTAHHQEAQQLSTNLKQSLLDRGPDYLGTATRTASTDAQGLSRVSLTFTSTVLALRGDHVAKQPFEELESDSVLCWNGEAWKIDGHTINGNDGEAIFAQLKTNPFTDTEHRRNHILHVLRSLQGPFAFLYYDAPGKCLYFGRDRLGRRSLLINRTGGAKAVALSSVADSLIPAWKEVAADGIYSMLLDSDIIGNAAIRKDDWTVSGEADLVLSIGKFNMSLPEHEEKLDFDSPSVDLVRRHLTSATQLRVLNVPEPPFVHDHQSEVDTRVAVLFSGGIDCTLVARLTHDVLPASQGIDLINVAFQNARNAASQQDTSDDILSKVYEACPDRVTGRKAFAELQTACPSRRWRFIAVNIPFTEAMLYKPRVVSLMYPHNTEMDLSIALALYFASRGVGHGYTNETETSETATIVTTPARVLLSGLGADELFGGYSRHEVAFRRNGYTDLIEELKLDVSRIGERNLGRDDRILSSWGKEVRFPFLDEEFIKYSIECQVWEKCDFANPSHEAGVDPAKRVLRLLADQLQLPSTAREKKRAIQFGARTAKIEQRTGGPKTKGTDTIS